ncbi:MAG: hypothetical protein LBU83_06075 [Bacteroidales bacterium]|jgi:antitoxin (DNA-binding transcriptional repressor) of toxin-antitoxin stability system|nr:hypothetical protein [Bacteroidales bacterium]
MKAMTVGELKSRFSEVLEEVKHGHNVGVLYGRAKKPIAIITPYKEEEKKRKIGLLDERAKFEETEDGKITMEEFLGV